MSGGYYDPETPGHHALNEKEFSKACGGVLAAYAGGYSSYLGVDRVKRILFRVANDSGVWDKSEGMLLDTMIGSDQWSFAELERAFEITLMALCWSWSGYLGVDEVRRALVFLIDEHDWEGQDMLARQAVARLIALDRQKQGAD